MEFEGELEQEDVDDFLRQFELELAEEEENEANESVNTQSSVDENAGNIADMSAMQSKTAPRTAVLQVNRLYRVTHRQQHRRIMQSFLKT